MSSFLKTLLLAIILVSPVVIEARLLDSSGGSIVPVFKPKNPGPNQEIIITLDGYGYNINRSLIRWEENNNVLKEGVGEKQLNFTTGAIGSKHFINVTILTDTGRQVTGQILLDPAEVDMVWEGLTVNRPNYQGGNLALDGGEVRVVAIPQMTDSQGQLMANDELLYEWRIDGQKVINIDNKQKYLDVRLRIDRPIRVRVTVTNPVTETKTSNLLILRSKQKPVLAIYEVKPLMGPIYNRGIRNIFEIDSPETVLKAELYHLPPDISNKIRFNWLMEDKKIASSGSGGELLGIEAPATLSESIPITVEALFPEGNNITKSFMIKPQVIDF
ncbi:MAG: hypothetical protein ACOCU8_02725 [Patescibacteria group bacterium]